MIRFSYDHLLKTYCHAEGISRFWEMQTWRNTNICRYIHIYVLWYVWLCWLRREKPIVSAMEETRSLCSWVKQRGLQEHMLLTLSVSYIPSKQKGRVRNRRVRVAYVQRPAMANKSESMGTMSWDESGSLENQQIGKGMEGYSGVCRFSHEAMRSYHRCEKSA